MKYRISEGGGQCYYILGVEDNGHPSGLSIEDLSESITTLEAMAAEVDAIATIVHSPPGTEGRRCAVVNVRRAAASTAPTLAEVRVAVAGGVDGGKSTLISVLTHGSDGKPDLDNGRGSARMVVLRHKHEIESGRTSCITHRIIGYAATAPKAIHSSSSEPHDINLTNSGASKDPCSAVLNYSKLAQFTPRELSASASKLVRVSDLGGHQRYSKTSLHGLTSTSPDYAMLCVCAAQGLSWVTRDHLAVALALGVPAFVVVTRVDAVEESRVMEVLNEVADVAAHGPGDIAHIASVDEAIRISKLISIARNEGRTQPMLPVLCTSSVTGVGIDHVHAFLETLAPCTGHINSLSSSGRAPITAPGNLPCMHNMEEEYSSFAASHFQIDAFMQVAGVGPVLSGVVLSGCLTDGDSLLLGPDDDGTFHPVQITGLHRAQVEVEYVVAGQHATVAIAPVIAATTKEEDQHSDSSTGYDEDYEQGDRLQREIPVSVKEYSSSERGVILSQSWSPQTTKYVDGSFSSKTNHNRSMQSPFSSSCHLGDTSPGCERPHGSQHAQHDVDNNNVEAYIGSFDDEGADATYLLPPKGTHSYKSHTSCKDMDILGKSWEFIRHLSSSAGTLQTPSFLLHAAAAEPAVHPPRIRKGTVLIHPSMHPQACDTTFEALVAVLGGRWPAGILVREEDTEGGPSSTPALSLASSSSFEAQASGSCSGNESSSTSVPKVVVIEKTEDTLFVEGSLRRCLSQRSQRSQRPATFQFMCHCGGVRQAAQIVESENLDSTTVPEEMEEEWARVLAGAEAARGVLLTSTVGRAFPSVPTAKVVLRFLHRPEWMRPGSRMIFRDRGSGKVAGIGIIVNYRQG